MRNVHGDNPTFKWYESKMRIGELGFLSYITLYIEYGRLLQAYQYGTLVPIHAPLSYKSVWGQISKFLEVEPHTFER